MWKLIPRNIIIHNRNESRKRRCRKITKEDAVTKERWGYMYKDSRAIRCTRHQYASSCICIMSSRVDDFSRYRLIILKSIYDKIGRRPDRERHLLFPYVVDETLWQILICIKHERDHVALFLTFGDFCVFTLSNQISMLENLWVWECSR